MSEKYSRLQRVGMLFKAYHHIRHDNFRDAATLVTNVMADRIERFVDRKVIPADFDEHADVPITGVFSIPLGGQYNDYKEQLVKTLAPLKKELENKGINITMSRADSSDYPYFYVPIRDGVVLNFTPAAKAAKLE